MPICIAIEEGNIVYFTGLHKAAEGVRSLSSLFKRRTLDKAVPRISPC